ncbi:hypothetical protein LJB62_08135 [Bacillus sp. DFI.2.34]|nr:hypothetical protein [Bacillus sp. DFI.2.34]
MLVFDDEPRSRHRFWVRNACFWRRAPFSSPFFGEKRLFLATSPVLVANFVIIKDLRIPSLINQVKLILVTESIMLK